MIVRLHPEVYVDLLDAIDYYDREAVPELAVEFYAEFRRCTDQLSLRPESFPITEFGLRRFNLHRFPFHILFEVVNETTIEILVVKHDHRDPMFGTDRS
ncbi:MAG: type II toxin-antitoxin system RelE/ParE family toxin [Pyrinomonadaceae bacterium]